MNFLKGSHQKNFNSFHTFQITGTGEKIKLRKRDQGTKQQEEAWQTENKISPNISVKIKHAKYLNSPVKIFSN